MAETIEMIRWHHRQRQAAMDQRKRLDLSLGAFLRRALGWSLNLPASERAAINKRAQALIDDGERSVRGKDPVDPDFGTFAPMISAYLMSREPFDTVERSATREMTRLAKTLPVWPWCSQRPGIGAVSLAMVVAEAGDLALYPTHSHLWKRMGMAPLTKDGRTRAASSWRMSGGLNADDWTMAGYSPRRRSLVFQIGATMVRNRRAYYRPVYDARKAFEAEKAKLAGLAVLPAAKIPKKRAAECVSEGVLHLRAQRYMEKRFLRDLWRAWRHPPP